MRKIVASILGFASILTGCAASNVAQFYHAEPNSPPVAKDVGEPEIRQGSGDNRQDIYAAVVEGWGLIGYSAFNGPQAPKRMVAAQAKEVGAGLVIENTRYSDTQNAGTMATTAFTRYGAFSFAAPVAIDRYHQVYIFFAKRPHVGLGVSFVKLTAEEHASLGTNKGLRVAVVVSGSPAFQADVLPGDVVLAVNGVPVFDNDSVRSAVKARYGQQADLTISRDGQIIHKVISLAPGGAW